MNQVVQVGDFVLVPIPGAAGKLISVGEWLDGTGFSDYDHAEIFVGNPKGMSESLYGYTLGAYPDGARCYACPGPPLNTKGSLWSSGYFYLTQDDRATIAENAMALVGTPYSAADYFAIAAHRLHLPVPLLKNYVASSKHMICSQLVDYVYMESGIHLFDDGRWPGYVTPEDLANLIKSRQE